MKIPSILPFLLLLISGVASAQDLELYQEFYESFPEFREERLSTRRFTHNQVTSLLESVGGDPAFEVAKVGESIEGRSLNLVSIGEGPIDVLLWSQMHGDESTATMALFDLFNFLSSDKYGKEKETLLAKVKLHFLPMLNPDGAQRFQRRNLLGVDVNRDALRLQSPEARTLKRIRDSLEADFGFNLHDQSRYYNVEGTEKPATISFLAPAYDYEKSINEVRGRAMDLIVLMNQVLQELAPGHIGRYNDDFEPRAFGDNIQKWGTSTVLIESGGYPGDPEKQEIRRLNFTAILAAIFSIASQEYTTMDREDYEKIPNNDSKLFDLKISGVHWELLGQEYLLDVGINRSEVPGKSPQDFFYKGYMSDRGDLSTHYGYEDRDLSGYRIEPAKVYPQVLSDRSAVRDLHLQRLLEQGYAYVQVRELPEGEDFTEFPVVLVSPGFTVPRQLGATFLLSKAGSVEYAVINGFLIDTSKAVKEEGNGLILN